MAIGDALWSRGSLEERANAYQAYIAALQPAARIGFEAFLRVGVHAAKTLHTLFRDEDRLETLDVIEKQTRRWLRRQHAAAKHDDLALWPLRLARRILERKDVGKNLSGREMTTMLTDELERGTGLSLRNRRPRSVPHGSGS